MEDNQSAILLKKIESACFELTAYPCLEDLSENLAKECLGILSDVSGGAAIQLQSVSASAKECERLLQEAEEAERALYFCELKNTNYACFASMASHVAAALSEAMLGGEFKIPDEGEKATSVDVAVLLSVVNRLMTFFGGYEYPNNWSGEIASPAPAKRISASDNEVKGLRADAFCTLSLDIGIEPATAKSALSFHLPIEFLEERGLLATGRKRNADAGENSRWRTDMTSNIHRSEIELDFVLDTYKTQLSELSNLEVGQVIPLSDNPERAIDIVLKTTNGQCVIGAGRLGACREAKAIKITSPLDPKPTPKA